MVVVEALRGTAARSISVSVLDTDAGLKINEYQFIETGIFFVFESALDLVRTNNLLRAKIDHSAKSVEYRETHPAPALSGYPRIIGIHYGSPLEFLFALDQLTWLVGTGGVVGVGFTIAKTFQAVAAAFASFQEGLHTRFDLQSAKEKKSSLQIEASGSDDTATHAAILELNSRIEQLEQQSIERNREIADQLLAEIAPTLDDRNDAAVRRWLDDTLSTHADDWYNAAAALKDQRVTVRAGE